MSHVKGQAGRKHRDQDASPEDIAREKAEERQDEGVQGPVQTVDLDPALSGQKKPLNRPCLRRILAVEIGLDPVSADAMKRQGDHQDRKRVGQRQHRRGRPDVRSLAGVHHVPRSHFALVLPATS